MKILKERFLFTIFLVLNLIFFMSTNYIISRNLKESSYGMSKKYIKLINTNDNRVKHDISFLLKFNDISVIAETENNEIVGLYDPTMNYYIHSSKIRGLGRYRYFSFEDYKNKNNVAIYINENSDPKEAMYNAEKFINFEGEKYDIISIFLNPSKIYKENLKYIVNIFAMDTSNFKTIYVDSNNKKSLLEVKEKFMNLGYVNSSESSRTGFVELINNSVNDKYSSFVLFPSIVMIILFIYTYLIYLSSYHKNFMLNLNFGATFNKMFIKFLKKIVGIYILSCILAIALIFVFFNYINKNYLYITDYILIISLFITTMTITTYLSFALLLKKSKKTMR